MEILIKAAQLITSLAILVTLHEFGHFIPAKLFKTRVEKFYCSSILIFLFFVGNASMASKENHGSAAPLQKTGPKIPIPQSGE